MSRTFKLTLAYDGTDFAGWQVQPDRETIQQTLQAALHRVTGERVTVVGSGRTDAGVHALGQVASCRLDCWRHQPLDLVRAINSHLPESIVVQDCQEVAEGFHAIRDAVSKRYRYQMRVGGRRNAFDYRYRWHLKGPLDFDAMGHAAAAFVGVHDFASFQATGSDRKTTVRNLLACDVIVEDSNPLEGVSLSIEVEADGFLYNMVRNIVGTLVEVGWGKRSADSIETTLRACDRDAAGPTAPAQGLFLISVQYRPDTQRRT